MQKELLYFFEKLSEHDKKEIIEFTKVTSSPTYIGRGFPNLFSKFSSRSIVPTG